MPYEKKRAVVPVRSVEGRSTFGEILRMLHGDIVEEHTNLFNELKTRSVNEYRQRFTALLAEELTPEEAALLGEKKKNHAKRLRKLSGLIRSLRATGRKKNYELMERIIREYEAILREIRQGRR